MWTCWIGALLLTWSPTPKYNPYELYQLAAAAERVVSGSIVALQERTFDLAVERELLGSTGATRLRIERFFDWPCARRWGEYRVGQRVLLFLRDNRAIGAGDEGDWPMVDAVVLAPYPVPGSDWCERVVDGEKLGGSLVTLDQLGSALNGYRRVFCALKEPGRQLRIELALDEAAVQQFARSSLLARELVEETLSSSLFLTERPRPPEPIGR